MAKVHVFFLLNEKISKKMSESQKDIYSWVDLWI